MKGKHLITLLSILLIAALCCGCATPKADTEDHRPRPDKALIEESDNLLGARFGFTLGAYSEQFSRNLSRLYADAPTLSESSWTMLEDALPESNGVAYIAYSTTLGYATLTAAVENDSAHIMSLGCGCAAARFADEDDRSSMITLAAVTAQTAGGFDMNSLDYLRALYEDVSADYSTLTYEQLQFSARTDGESVVLTLSVCAE